MNKFAKIAFVFVLAAAGGVSTLQAQDFVSFQSTENGFCINVPDDMSISKNEETLIELESEENGTTLSVHPLLTENLTTDDLTNGMDEIAKSVELKLSEMESTEIKNPTVEGIALNGEVQDGVSLIIGAVKPYQNDAIAYLFTFTYPSSMSNGVIETILNSISFNADIVE